MGEGVKVHVFEGATTYIQDYRTPPADGPQKREILKWPSEVSEKPPVSGKYCVPKFLKKECNESLTTLRQDVYVPFNLLWSAKGDNTNVKNIVAKPVDARKQEAINTRPRLYLSPAGSIDDIPDKETRDLMVRRIYKTTSSSANDDISKFWEDRSRNLGTVPCPESKEPHFMVQELPRPPFTEGSNMRVSTDLRRYYKRWDDSQKRCEVDPTSYFWNHTDIPKKRVYDLLSQEEKLELSRLAERNELRMGHDLVLLGYSGNRPTIAKGIPLRKQFVPATHPFTTSSQAANIRYEEDARDGLK